MIHGKSFQKTELIKEATYNIYIFFKKYIYTGGQWFETDTIESAVWQFRSAKLTPTGTPGADGTYGTGGQTGSDPDATITGEASATSSNGATEPDLRMQYQQPITHRSEPCPHWQWHPFLQVDM